MASSAINKLITSATTLQNEVTVAAANLNFDFTLIRLEAPKEYRGINDSLSEVRRQSAESGTLHRTARKLGALFDGIPPPADSLLSAYGKRVSEICERANIKSKQRENQGVFARFVGTDSGSLWAAATSGTNAIAVHLLACMVAEIFDGAQSVALWYQLIERRKHEIEDTLKDEMDEMKAMTMALASKQDFSREELAAWDNSARSWIRTANMVMAKQRGKALLYTDKAGADVNKLPDPYHSVMKAWQDGMTSMDSLITGTPQMVRNGAVLLAMTSWHLYPDLCVLSHGPGVMAQDDQLFPGSGILTIDLEHPEGIVGGVAWSLPLSYLRYYGEPVIVDRTLGVNSSRISMDQFRFVLLGCVLSTWSGFTKSVDEALDLILLLIEALRWPERSSQNPSELARMQKMTGKTSWIGQLLTAAEDFADGNKVERGTARKLIDHGRRHARFLSEPREHPLPFFGLCHIPSMFSLLDGPEPRIEYLRVLAKDLGLSNDNCIIRYFYSDSFYEYTTIEPVGGGFGSHNTTGYLRRPMAPAAAPGHLRWIPIRRTREPCQCEGNCLSVKECENQAAPMKNVFRLRGMKTGSPRACPCLQAEGCSIECHDWKSEESKRCLAPSVKGRVAHIRDSGEDCLPAYEIATVDDPRNGRVDFGNGAGFEQALTNLAKRQFVDGGLDTFVRLEFCVGDFQRAEILRTGPMTPSDSDPRKGQPGRGSLHLGHFFTANALQGAFKPRHFQYHELTEWFATDLRAQHGSFTQSLRACATAVGMYGCLPEATVDPSIVGKVTLATADWVPSRENPIASPLRVKLSRPEAFAAIAMFESGRLLDPQYLRNVFAMTSGNSIFVANPMLADPYEVPVETEIKRVPGNIGKPGLSLLVPPPEPKVRKANLDSWTVLDYKAFSGHVEDNFWKTSMHLSLTQYQPGLPNPDLDEHYIDENASLRETLVQVYDSSEWVCDLDVISSLKSSRLSRVVCVHSAKHLDGTPDRISFEELQRSFHMVSIDSWEELLTPPLDPALSMIRTADNWLSRLAAVGVSIRLNRWTIILPSGNDVCWACVRQHIVELGLSEEDLASAVVIL